VLRHHAESVLPQAYPRAVERATAETELPAASFPKNCPYTLEELLSPQLLDE
jgi:hypothetical protein